MAKKELYISADRGTMDPIKFPTVSAGVFFILDTYREQDIIPIAGKRKDSYKTILDRVPIYAIPTLDKNLPPPFTEAQVADEYCIHETFLIDTNFTMPYVEDGEGNTIKIDDSQDEYNTFRYNLLYSFTQYNAEGEEENWSWYHNITDTSLRPIILGSNPDYTKNPYTPLAPESAQSLNKYPYLMGLAVRFGLGATEEPMVGHKVRRLLMEISRHPNPALWKPM